MYSKALTLVAIIASTTAMSVSDVAAQGALDDEAEKEQARQIEKDLEKPNISPVEWGVGIRARYVVIPRFLLEQFWEEINEGPGNFGFGIDVIRKRKNFEFSFGIEFESLNAEDGFWLEKGDDAVSNGQTPDFVDFDGFAWLTLDASFIFHKPLHELFALRYGGGFGLGVIFGEVKQTDSTCTGRNINDAGVCMIDPGGAQVNDPANIPPVFPVVNILFGGQFRPVPEVLLNLELGIRTAPFIGFSGQYLF